MGKKKIMLIIIAVAACVAAAVIAIVLLAGRKKDTYRIIKVSEVEGTAYVKRGSIDDLQAYENMLLESGDTVTLESGSMTLKLDDDKYVYVEEQTEFTLVAEGDSNDSRTRIELKKGAITNEIENKLSTDSSYEVNTPNATMAVRGTIFRVEVTFDDKGVCHTKVSVLEGEVESGLVYADGTVSEERVAVNAGYEVIIYQDDRDTDYLNGGAMPIDFSKLPESVRERFRDIIHRLIEERDASGTGATTEETAAKESTEQAEYTVSFYYNGSVFGTQKVRAGETASIPTLMPEASGKWDYDFTQPVMSDVTVNWVR